MYYCKIMNKSDALNKIAQIIQDISRRQRLDKKKQVMNNRPANEKSIKQAEVTENRPAIRRIKWKNNGIIGFK